MADSVTQVRDYLDSIAIPVTVEDVIAYRPTPTPPAKRKWSGPIVAIGAAIIVTAFGIGAVLIRSEDPQAAGSMVANEVIAGNAGDSHYAVGFSSEGELCAEAGISSAVSIHSQAACGRSDQIEAVAYQGNDSVALSGWVPDSAARLTAIFNGDIRRQLELTPIPGRDLYAFGAIATVQARFIEIEVVDNTGTVIQRFFPSIGPISTPLR